MNQPPNQAPPHQYPPQGYAPNPYQPPAAPYMPPGMPGHGHGYGYEFNDAQNKIISSAATWTMVVGVITILSAAGNLLNKQIINVVLNAVIGGSLIAASMAFKKVVTTQGEDVPHLMKALKNFSTVLLIRIIVLCIAGVFLVLAGVVVAFMATR